MNRRCITQRAHEESADRRRLLDVGGTAGPTTVTYRRFTAEANQLVVWVEPA